MYKVKILVLGPSKVNDESLDISFRISFSRALTNYYEF